ncbi:uncharacterized protein LOC133498181 [Syngnathoides biaculeatus]|uniref:uncharacterized protein LOC133498181 n=1 Tax=Syngnathoides biaculeatus TaxID=300417 RepID=UPI002ADDBF06|nr:uncharacterized protein LOC133498181 [Syngnathoides biaculeatus]
MASRKRSKVWEYFARSKESKDESECKICKKLIKCGGGSTSSMAAHVEKVHGLKLCDDKDSKVARVEGACSTDKYLLKKSMIEEVSKLAAVDGLSLNAIANSEFIQRNLRAQKHHYDKPPPSCGNTVKAMLYSFFQTKKKELTKYFNNKTQNGHRYSITLDEYTAIQNKRLMNINVHSKDEHWSLGLVQIDGSLDANKAAQTVGKHLSDFGLDIQKDIVGCTTDGAAVMVKFGREVTPDHQQCIAHCMHLAVCNVLYKVNEHEPRLLQPNDPECDSPDSESEGNADEESEGEGDSEVVEMYMPLVSEYRATIDKNLCLKRSGIFCKPL